MPEFDKMYTEFEEWKKTQEAFAQVWMTAYRAGERAERDACAEICKQQAQVKTINGSTDYNTGREMGATVCEHAIRAGLTRKGETS